MPSDETRAITIERELRETLRRTGRPTRVAVTVHPRIAEIISGEDGLRLAELERETGKEIRLEHDSSLLPDAVRTRALDDVAAAPAPPARTSASRRRVSSRS